MPQLSEAFHDLLTGRWTPAHQSLGLCLVILLLAVLGLALSLDRLFAALDFGAAAGVVATFVFTLAAAPKLTLGSARAVDYGLNRVEIYRMIRDFYAIGGLFALALAAGSACPF